MFGGVIRDDGGPSGILSGDYVYLMSRAPLIFPCPSAGDRFQPGYGEEEDLAEELIVGFEEGVAWLKNNLYSIRVVFEPYIEKCSLHFPKDSTVSQPSLTM